MDKTKDEAAFEPYLEKLKRSPRINGLLDAFGRIASGEDGQPAREVDLDEALLGFDKVCLEYSVVRKNNSGIFNSHFIASLPYALEEQCRFGAAIFLYGKRFAETNKKPMSVYTLGDGSGVTARSLTEISGGGIRTLTCSPNKENRIAFDRRKTTGAHFHLGPFFDVTPEALMREGLADFREGFDLIVEDTTFQMYGPERSEPIELAARNLRKDGIFVLIEKFSHSDVDEYLRRENQKDIDFKLRYFDAAQVENKKRTVLGVMDNQLVTLEEIAEVLGKIFSHSVVTWNSGNFSTIVSSNNERNLLDFIASMIEPAIPDEYRYLELPFILNGNFLKQPVFRCSRRDVGCPV